MGLGDVSLSIDRTEGCTEPLASGLTEYVDALLDAETVEELDTEELGGSNGDIDDDAEADTDAETDTEAEDEAEDEAEAEAEAEAEGDVETDAENDGIVEGDSDVD